jgi:Holliday junction DNA helicase RuvA
VVVDVSGVGYEILVPSPIMEEMSIGGRIRLLTYHHVRENGQELFGFTDRGQKELFTLLLGVSGIGPKGALAIMSLGEHEQIRKAIAGGNAAFLAGAQGVGKKSAERVCVELKDKVGVMGGEVVAIPEDGGDDAQTALVTLGYTAAQAAQALAGVDGSLPTEDRVRQALKELA